MSKFNLTKEPWIKVIIDDKGRTEEVSLIQLFQNAHKYKELAGEMETQNFAVMRILLAVLHTVFSRYDANGNEYGFFDIDDKMRQITEINPKFEGVYSKKLFSTWTYLWNEKKFPNIITKYLECWEDRFYLFDDKYPFMQVTEEIFNNNGVKGTEIEVKNINRLISESGNKKSVFSPKIENDKNIVSISELLRWIIMLQGYIGTSDKTKLKKEPNITQSKGWLYDLGGIYLKGDNIFETLMLNFNIINEEKNNLLKIQSPCWEQEIVELMDKYYKLSHSDNVAALYTAYSRAVIIKENDEKFSIKIAKVPEVPHEDNFLECMTLYKYDKKIFNSKKHRINQFLWRSFGLITLNGEEQRKPGIMEWLSVIRKEQKDIKNKDIFICTVGMEDDGNATSWVPINEIVDFLKIGEFILTDLDDEGWTRIINDEIEKTKLMIDKIYWKFLNDIKSIRNIDSKAFINNQKEELYYLLDAPFRKWLSSIKYNDDKNEKCIEWRKEFKTIVINKAKEIIEHAGSRDYRGIEDGKGIKNIATAYNNFIFKLNKEMELFSKGGEAN